MADTEHKESAWWKPALSFFLAGAKALTVIVTVLAVLIATGFAWVWFRPDHFFNPINRFAHLKLMECRQDYCPMPSSWAASLVPDVFAIGEHREEIIRRLSEAGYVPNGSGDRGERYDLYGAGTTNLFVCSSDFHVLAKFDTSGRLTSAESLGTGACL